MNVINTHNRFTNTMISQTCIVSKLFFPNLLNLNWTQSHNKINNKLQNIKSNNHLFKIFILKYIKRINIV